MVKIKVRFIQVVYGVTIIAADIFVYIILGISLMGYDDNWDSSKGKYGSLASMTTTDKSFHFAFIVWNLINVIGIIYVGQKIYKRIKYVT